MKQPTSKRGSTPKSRTSRKSAAEAPPKKRSWVRRHPAVVLGTVAAGVGAYALLSRKSSKKGVSSMAKAKAGPRATKSAR